MVMTPTQDKPPTNANVPPIAIEAAGELAAQLGETEIEARRQIVRALRVIGEERTRAFVAQARAVEAAGGMMLKSGSRRHTPVRPFLSVNARRAHGRRGRPPGRVPDLSPTGEQTWRA